MLMLQTYVGTVLQKRTDIMTDIAFDGELKLKCFVN